MNIKPIETKYKGYRFRSRLEARWAVFFDALNIKWEYEYEGYVLDNNTWYLPDFYLPNQDCYLEIKPTFPTTDELRKIAAMVKVKENRINPSYMAIGVPGLPKLSVSPSRKEKTGIQYHLSDGSVLFEIGGPIISICAFSFINVKSEPKVDICNLYGDLILNKDKMQLDLHYEIEPHEITREEVSNLLSYKNFMYCGLTYPFESTRRLYQGDGRSFIYPTLLKAYEAARSARFEFGESGV